MGKSCQLAHPNPHISFYASSIEFVTLFYKGSRPSDTNSTCEVLQSEAGFVLTDQVGPQWVHEHQGSGRGCTLQVE